MNKVLVGAVAEGAIEKFLRNITAAQKEGKDQQVIPESEPQVVPATQANRSDEVAKLDAFPAGKVAQAKEAADIDQRSIDRPPVVRRPSRSAAMQCQ